MQETIFYVAAGETLGSVRDFANAKSAAPPTLVRGVSALLRMRLFANREGVEPYLVEVLSGIVRWQWAMDTDFSEATAYKLQADNASITLSEVQDDIDGDEYAYTEVSIPMPGMNTVELAELDRRGEEQKRPARRAGRLRRDRSRDIRAPGREFHASEPHHLAWCADARLRRLPDRKPGGRDDCGGAGMPFQRRRRILARCAAAWRHLPADED